jgi:hypothetical protein
VSRFARIVPSRSLAGAALALAWLLLGACLNPKPDDCPSAMRGDSSQIEPGANVAPPLAPSCEDCQGPGTDGVNASGMGNADDGLIRETAGESPSPGDGSLDLDEGGDPSAEQEAEAGADAGGSDPANAASCADAGLGVVNPD